MKKRNIPIFQFFLTNWNESASGRISLVGRGKPENRNVPFSIRETSKVIAKGQESRQVQEPILNPSQLESLNRNIG